MKKKIAILGSTGSVGRQVLDIIEKFPNQFEVLLLSASKVSENLINQIKKFKPKYVYLKEYANIDGVKVLSGKEGIKETANLDADLFVNAVSGIDGVEFTYYLLQNSKTLATANKEAIVCLGEILGEKFKEIIPLDSEHSAIYQTLENINSEYVENIYLTSSGGPFLNKDFKEFKNITVEEALNHPKWSMGKKITVDSATLLNKGLEVIEAHYLFNIPYENLKVVIHPQSIIHGLVELIDGNICAHLSDTDMRFPISYALFYPERKYLGLKKLNLFEIQKLEFFEPDTKKFPLLKVAIEVGKKGGAYPIVLTVADEIVVNKFLEGKIGFLDIYKVIAETLNNANFEKPKNLEDVLYIIEETKQIAGDLRNIIKYNEN